MAALSALHAPALAQPDAAHVIDVPAGSASRGIALLARQTDLQILAPAADLRGQRTNAVRGRLEAREALQKLLAGTRLRVAADSGRVITVRRLPDPAPDPGGAATARRRGDPPQQSVALVALTAAPEPVLPVQEVVVTGSLVIRTGNQAPTPVTVVETARLHQSAPTNIPDGLNQLPQFSGSRSETQNSQIGTAISPVAGNYLNLRNLGIVRSLILLDGQRVPPTSYEGAVDTNILPQALIQRVEVVTAGASATYGSDALTGVVNFILDKSFTGLKGSVQGGASEYGDNRNYRLSLAGGMPVLGDRGHLLFSVEHYQADGIKDRAARPYMRLGSTAFGNGTTIPYDMRFNTRVAISTYGGLALGGPLNFFKFEPGGAITPFDRGTAQLGGVQIGGDGSETVLGSLVGSVRTEQVFARASYAVSERLTGFVQLTFGEARNRFAHVGADSRFGNMTIFSGNAFLRPEVQSILTASDTPSFTFSRHTLESGKKIVDMLSSSGSVFAGLEGRLGEDWDWRLSYAGGESILRAAHTRNPENTRLTAAVDAVRDPAGNIVCRVSLTSPGAFPGCVPVNFFGVGAPSKAALDYIYGQTSQSQVRNDLHDMAFNANGPLFETPAGEVIAAIGAEYRTQSLRMTSNANPAAPLVTTGLRGFPTGQGRFGNTNQGVADGHQYVREVFGEIFVPLLRDLPLVHVLEFNGAGRLTDYSTSGRVETWKAGFSYRPNPDLRLRATRSRDIRAPTLNELFAGPQLNAGTFDDVHTGQTVVLTTIRSGNRALAPEIGQTTTIGLVYQPRWLPAFSASADYYDIDIRDAINTRTNTQLNQDCEDSNGSAVSCTLVFRPFPFSDRSPANAVQRIQTIPLNLARTFTHGIDFDVNYRLPLGDFLEGSDAVLTFRILANYAPSLKQRETETAAVQQQAGVLNNNNAKIRATISVNYANGPVTVNLQRRYIGELVRSNQPNIRFADNDIDSERYYNLAISYRFRSGQGDLEAFLNINNLFDAPPPLIPFVDQPGLRYPTNQILFDVIGRRFNGGLRFSF